MNRVFKLPVRLLPIGVCLGIVLSQFVVRADSDAPRDSSKTTNGAPYTVPTPGTDDGRIAFWTAYLLQNYHYSHQRFDDNVSSQFLDRYVESLDPQHLHFLQSDLAEFEKYRTNLDDLTFNPRRSADTRPAFEIFARFMERMQQRVAFADELLKNEKFRFDTNERILIDRREAAYPQDLAEAKTLWNQRLRFEYLQEKLGQDAKKADNAKSNTAASTTNNVPQAGSDKSDSEQIVDTLTHRYHRTLRMFRDWNNEDVMGYYLTALSHVYDPHSDYFNKAELEGFQITMNLQLFGIGAELRSEDGYCKIFRLLPGGPAIKSKKILSGDRIVAVAQSNQPPVDVIDMSLNKIVQMIRGPKGTEVRLTVMPAGANSSERPVITLVRDEIPLEDQAAKGKIIELPDAKGGSVRLGVVNLPSFYAPMGEAAPIAGANAEPAGSYTSVDVAKLLTKFKQENVSGVILDLRANGGGSLEEAIRVTGLFIKEGPVVQTKEIDGSRRVEQDKDTTVVYDGPLIVLTSRFSASASEIVAGALQDYGRALVVGDVSTHGKGTVQTVTKLNSFLHSDDPDVDKAGALKFTIRKFYRASGASTQLKGVMPDIVLPSIWNYSEDVGEKALKNPLPWDTIKSESYEKVNGVQPYLSELLRRSSQRVATNQDFTYIRQDIEEFRKRQADKSYSLNEAQRLKEQEEADARQKAREKEIKTRKDPNQKIYEITLKQAAMRGLPPPVGKTNSVAAAKPATDTAKPGTAPENATEASSTTKSSEALAAHPTDLADDTDDADKPAAVDADLNESELIMLDYMGLLGKQGQVALTGEATH